jgi:hypothetical protein
MQRLFLLLSLLIISFATFSQNQEKKLGWNGSVFGNIGNNGRYNGGLSMGYQLPKLSIMANYNYREDRRYFFSDDRRIVTPGDGSQLFINQNISSRTPVNTHIGSLSLNWTPTASDRFTISGSYNRITSNRAEDNVKVERIFSNAIADYNRKLANDQKRTMGMGTVGYSHLFGKDNSLTLDYSYNQSNDADHNCFTNIYTVPVQNDLLDHVFLKDKERESLFRSVYSNQWSQGNRLLVGYELKIDHSDMNDLAADRTDNAWVTNTSRSSSFLNDQTLHSLYATWDYTSGQLSLTTGLRAEQTNLNSKLVAQGEKSKDHYSQLSPSFRSAYQLDANNRLQFSYALRVNRPKGRDLNPFANYLDPYNLMKGNTDLKPEKLHAVELSWMYQKAATSFAVTPYYHYTLDKMTMVFSMLSGGVELLQRGNLKSATAAGTVMTLNSGLGSWFNFNVNSDLSLNRFDASNLDLPDKKNVVMWNLVANANFIPFSNMLIQVNTRHIAFDLPAQGTKDATYIVNMGAKYEIPKQHLALAAMISDLFDTYRSTYRLKLISTRSSPTKPVREPIISDLSTRSDQEAGKAERISDTRI